jgi:hypothetical protein
MLLEFEDRESFTSDIASLFFDVVDNHEIYEIADDVDLDEDLTGMHYHINDFGLRLDLKDPYLEIHIWVGNDELHYSDNFINIESDLNLFCKKLDMLGYKYSVEPIRDYIEYTIDEWNPDPYTIFIYYPKN